MRIERAMGADLLERVEFLRLHANRRLNGTHKSDLGQFMTPAPVARLMASMLEGGREEIRLLDAGAGVGSLFVAALAELLGRKASPRRIAVTAFEIDPHLASYLPDSLALCRCACEENGITFTGQVVQADFLASVADQFSGALFSEGTSPRFNCAILNP